jgi:FkbH-like protein
VRITEALKILQAADKTSSAFPVTLVCGFTPIHLSTFLSAHLQARLPDRRVQISHGLYGDVAGALEALRYTEAHGIAVVLEWPELDPRLGFRSSGRWDAPAMDDILPQARRGLDRLAEAIGNLPRGVAVAVSAPTLPLPPLFHTPGWQAGAMETALHGLVAEFAAKISSVRLVNLQRLAEESAPGQRYDLKSDLVTGLPYSLGHADALGLALARLLVPPASKKGLITDLDETMWAGLVGEVGPAGVSWDLANHSALHGLYQKLLGRLAEEGVLLAVASKNDAAVVSEALRREDLLVPAASLYPVEAHWNAKSGSVGRILKRWNVLADSVVFVDDSPLELAEVAAAHPGIECIQFPGKDYGAKGLQMLRRIRDLFGKPRLSAEDALRASSIRNAAEAVEAGNTGEDFLRELNAVISFDFADEDARVLELVNKTNQFNLNGARFTEAEWRNKLAVRGSIVAVVSYEDKFGPLGKIGVLQGMHQGRTLRLGVWVLSCRAFARRIEQQCLRMLFERFEVESIELEFVRTAKNGPLAELLGGMPLKDLVLSRRDFDNYCPALYHTVKEARRVEVNG